MDPSDSFMSKLVELAALGTSGLSIFAMFWVGWLITRKDESKNIEAHKNIRFYMAFCLTICLISFAAYIWGGRAKPDVIYEVYGTVNMKDGTPRPGNIVFNAEYPDPSVDKITGEIVELRVRKDPNGRFPTISMTCDTLLPKQIAIQAELDKGRVSITNNALYLNTPIEMVRIPTSEKSP